MDAKSEASDALERTAASLDPNSSQVKDSTCSFQPIASVEGGGDLLSASPESVGCPSGNSIVHQIEDSECDEREVQETEVLINSEKSPSYQPPTTPQTVNSSIMYPNDDDDDDDDDDDIGEEETVAEDPTAVPLSVKSRTPSVSGQSAPISRQASQATSIIREMPPPVAPSISDSRVCLENDQPEVISRKTSSIQNIEITYNDDDIQLPIDQISMSTTGKENRAIAEARESVSERSPSNMNSAPGASVNFYDPPPSVEKHSPLSLLHNTVTIDVLSDSLRPGPLYAPDEPALQQSTLGTTLLANTAKTISVEMPSPVTAQQVSKPMKKSPTPTASTPKKKRSSAPAANYSEQFIAKHSPKHTPQKRNVMRQSEVTSPPAAIPHRSVPDHQGGYSIEDAIRRTAMSLWDQCIKDEVREKSINRSEKDQKKTSFEKRAAVRDEITTLQQGERLKQYHEREKYPNKRFATTFKMREIEDVSSLRATESERKYEKVFGVKPAASEAINRAQRSMSPRRSGSPQRGYSPVRAAPIQPSVHQSKVIHSRARLQPGSENSIEAIARLRKLQKLGANTALLSCPKTLSYQSRTKSALSPRHPEWRPNPDGTFLLPNGNIMKLADHLVQQSGRR